jgi:hypothetical protein
MFQGHSSNVLTSSKIRKAIQQQPFEQTVVNYNKNGEIYICLIKGFPVFNIKGKLSHFIALKRRHKKILLVGDFIDLEKLA